MSAGGVFKIIVNDGKADRMIMATKLLNQRIRNIMCARGTAGKADVTPTLVDLERTHILFVNSHFKPYAAIGFEYNKVRPQSGTPKLGNTVTYSIPQFGDFFNDMVHHVTLGTASSSAKTAPTQGTAGFPANDTDWDDGALTGDNSTRYSLVDAFGNDVTAGSGTYHNLVRYCEFPGERLHQNVKFDVNGNPLDEYNDVTATMLRKFTVGADKMAGYKRLMGQETPMEGYGGPSQVRAVDSHQSTASTAPDATLTLTGAGAIEAEPDRAHNQIDAQPSSMLAAHQAANFPDESWNDPTVMSAGGPTRAAVDAGTNVGYAGVLRTKHQAVDGPQTPKYQQPALEIWNKLNFWFNNDTRLSIPSVSIPFGQRFITIQLATQAQMVSEHSGLYVRQSFDTGAVTTGTASTTVGANTGASLNSRNVSYRPYVSAGTITHNDITSAELYVNNIFVNPEIHDIFIKRIGFSLIRVWRQHTASVSNSSDEKLLSQLKWPIEYMFVGLQPNHNKSSSNVNQHRDWHQMGKTYTYSVPHTSRAEVSIDVAGAPAGPGAVGHRSRIDDQHPVEYSKSTSTVQNMSVTAHGISINDTFPRAFYSDYNPFNYGQNFIVTPEDDSAMMVNFALFPGSQQPSGHINVSRAREFYLKWAGNYSGANTPTTLYAVARAINFLLITDGSAVLRYST